MDYRYNTPIKTEFYRPIKQEPGAYPGNSQQGSGQYNRWQPAQEIKREPPSDQWQHGDRQDRKRPYPYDDGGERQRQRQATEYAVKPQTPGQEPEAHAKDDTQVCLDTYNSDMHLIIDPSLYSATPLSNEGFAFMWAGARSTYGVRSGKVCFEVKIIQHLDVSHLPPDEINPHVVRVGFSCEHTSMQLGEESMSWGYGGTGKMSTNCQFKDYGTPFCEGDVVTCFLKMDSDPVEISFAKNGRHQGVAYRVPKSQLGDKALFPHVLTKNCSFEVNFGQRPQPYFPLPQGYTDFTFISCIALDKRERAPKGPAKKQDCEMIMMVGLPGCGKTTWAIEYCRQHPEKKYNILGTNNIIDKMKVMGLPRKRNYHGRWDVLIDKSTKSLNKMLEMGSKLLRNYILDQTNVYPTARRRKMKPFQGFKRKAVVIVPTDEEFRKRCAKQEKIEGKEVPESAILEMKAHFTLPEVGQLFDEVEFVELSKEEAEPLVKWYNDEGRKAAGSSQNRFKPNDQSQNQGGPPRKPQDFGNQGGNQWPSDTQTAYHSGRGGMGSGGYREPGPPAGRGPPPPRGPSGPPHGPPSDWGPQGSPRGPGSRGYDHNNQPPPGRDPYGGSSYEGNYGSQGYGGRDQWDSGYGRPGHMASPPPMSGGPGPSARSVPGTGTGCGGPPVSPDNKQWNQPAASRNPGPGGYDSKGYPGAAGDRYSSQQEDRWNQRNQDYGSPGYGQQHYGDHGTGPPQRFGEQGGYGSHQQYGDRYNEQKPYSNPVQSGPGNYSQQNYGQSSYGKNNYDQGGYGKSSYESQGYGKPMSNYDQGYGKPGAYDQSYGTAPPYAQDTSRAGQPQNQQWSQGKQWGPPGQHSNNQSQPPYGQYYGQGYGGGGQWK